ncbi:MAG: hypothetical protein Q7T03_00600 [Deltaproteobacteria bacterium]|nr:hypothetical protein [Deltaproteobacteria bacterium]
MNTIRTISSLWPAVVLGEVGEKKILKEIPLAEASFEITRLNAWVPFETTFEFVGKDGSIYEATAKLSYWCRKTSENSYTLFWRTSKRRLPPTSKDQNISFQLHKGRYPKDLTLIVEGDAQSEHPKVQGIRIVQD